MSSYQSDHSIFKSDEAPMQCTLVRRGSTFRAVFETQHPQKNHQIQPNILLIPQFLQEQRRDFFKLMGIFLS